jgi:hypothetical protein
MAGTNSFPMQLQKMVATATQKSSFFWREIFLSFLDIDGFVPLYTFNLSRFRIHFESVLDVQPYAVDEKSF